MDVFATLLGLIKSYVSAHTRTLPNGRVVQVRGFSDNRRVDAHTIDMFRQPLPAPKKRLTMEQAKHPERFTPDLFTGEVAAHAGIPIDGLSPEHQAIYDRMTRH